MAVRNGDRSLRRTVESVLAQTLDDFEFVVVDDGSSDRTHSILAEYAQRDSRLRIHYAETQSPGQAEPSNIGISLSRGHYIAKTDADDVSSPTRLAKQVAFLEARPEFGCVGSCTRWVNAEGQTVLTWTAPESHYQLKWQLCFGNIFAHSSAMFRREAFDAIGGYDVRRHYCEDYDLWCRLSRVTQVACLPEQMVTLVRHEDGVTGRHRETQLQRHIEAATDHIGMLCGLSLSHDEVRTLQNYTEGDAKSRRAASRTIVVLHRTMMRADAPPSLDRRAIRQDAARRLWRMALPQAAGAHVGWGALLYAIRLHPRLAVDAALRVLRPLFVLKNRVLRR